MATALYLRLDSILTELQNWNIVTPVGQFLDKAERYFNKVILNLCVYYPLTVALILLMYANSFLTR